MIKTLYRIPAPNSFSAEIEVYGDPQNAWYEWRIIDSGIFVKDTINDGQGRQYGQAEIALRDALMFSSGVDDDFNV